MNPVFQAPAYAEVLAEQLGLLFQRQALPMWVYDTGTLRILAANEAACAQYGYAADEFTALTILDLREAEYHEQIRQAAARVEGYRRLCTRHMRRDGSPIEVEVFSHDFPLAGRQARLVTAIDRSEQRVAERELQASRDLLCAITEGLPDAVFVKDRDGLFVFANSATGQVAGLTPEQLVGRTDAEAFGAETAALFRQNEYPVIAHGQNIEDEEHFTVEGRDRIFQTVKVPWRAATGEVQGIIGIARDVTDRKRMERDLQAVQERLRLVHEYSPFGSAITSLDGKWLHVNPVLCQMLGYSEAELQQLRYTDVTHPEDNDQAGLEKVQSMIRGETAHQRRTKRYIHKTGRVLWVDLTVAVARNAKNEAAYFIVHVEDITQRRETEAALRESNAELRSSRERLQMLMAQAPAVMWTTDHDLRINWTDGAGYRQLQTKPSEALGKSILTWFDEGSPPIQAHRDALAGRHRSYEVNLRGRWFNVYCDPLRAEDGSVVGVISFALDITAARQTEEALRQQEEQLRQSQKMEAIGRLAGGVAHDFNNLLTAITGHSELLLEEIDSRDPIVKDVEQIRRAAERAAGLTRQLLAFSRRQILQPTVLDARTVVSDIEPLLRRLIGEDIELSMQLSSDSCAVVADKGQLEQVIMNLVVNSRDAMPDGGRLVLECAPCAPPTSLCKETAELPPGEYVMLTIRDTGVGISAQNLPQIFEPFFTTKDRDKGTGLGLSTVYGIVQQSGGHILVESVVGEGTAFKILLSRVHLVPDAPVARTSTPSKRRHAETILLVEDELTVRQLIERSLRREGYTVITAANGTEATALVEQHGDAVNLC